MVEVNLILKRHNSLLKLCKESIKEYVKLHGGRVDFVSEGELDDGDRGDSYVDYYSQYDGSEVLSYLIYIHINQHDDILLHLVENESGDDVTVSINDLTVHSLIGVLTFLEDKYGREQN